MDKLQECYEHLIGFDAIMDKANEMQECCVDMSACCDVIDDGDVIRAILIKDTTGVKHRVYMTDDGSEPVQVPFAPGDPIETYLNTHLMKRIIFMGTELFELYLNGVIVFRRILELELPQFTTIINLEDFIAKNNPDDLPVIEVTNNLIQPGMISGNICHLEVELINNGEIQGLSSGGDALTITCPLTLTNNGWIRGAGGNGGNGSGIDVSKITNPVGVWQGRASYYDASAVPGYSDKWCNVSLCGIHAYYNRYWGSPGPSGGSASGAWVHEGSKGGQEYWDINNRSGGHAPIWGDQGPCHYNSSGYWCRAGMQVSIKQNITVSGGSIGRGGAGQGFRVNTDAGWSRGTDGYYSGPSSAHNPSTGKNIAVPAPGELIGEDGGHGGAWAIAGGTSEHGSNGGLPPGRAIVGSGHLIVGSVTGNVNGAIV